MTTPRELYVNAITCAGIVGDGCHDDTHGLQAVLDSGATTIYLPTPPGHYLISKTLVIHSGQTLLVDRQAVIRLADHAHAYLLTNADHVQGDQGITVIGGIWDGNNTQQTCEYHQQYNWRIPYDPQRYLGVLFQFNKVTDLRIAHLTFKDPETYGLQAGNLQRFTIEDITFDYNLLRNNMDGVHIHGNSHQGRIVNLKGTTNDDLVALNADDGSMFEISRGPITDILVDGIWSTNGYTAVRLLSAGSPVQRIALRNIFGTYRVNVVSLTNHNVHPGTASTFDDISLDGLFCAKAVESSGDSPIWIAAPAVVGNLTIRNYHRTEEQRAVDDIRIDAGATVRYLGMSDCSVINRTPDAIALLQNQGTIDTLQLTNIYLRAEGETAPGTIVRNTGTIHAQNTQNVVAGSPLDRKTALPAG